MPENINDIKVVNVGNIIQMNARGLTVTTMDFTLNAFTSLDSDLRSSPITITDTTKPASPQFTQTVSALLTNANIEDCCVFVSFEGLNNDTDPHDINWHITVNGTEITGTSGNTTVDGGMYSPSIGKTAVNALAANDIVGIKFWSDVSGQIDIRLVSVYVVPRKIISASNALYYYDLNNAMQKSGQHGTFAGVTFVNPNASNGANFTQFNESLNYDVQPQNGIFFFGSPFKIYQTLLEDINVFSSNQYNSETLYSIDNLAHYIYRYT